MALGARALGQVLALLAHRHGEPVPILEQNLGLWDQLLIRRGYAALLRAERLGRPLGPYLLQGTIAACHAQARSAEQTDWARIASLYQALSRLTPTPVVELNRAVAMASGPASGLTIIDAIAADPALRDSHLLPSVRGDLLARLGRPDEARAEFRHAATLASNTRERAVLERRAAEAGLADRRRRAAMTGVHLLRGASGSRRALGRIRSMCGGPIRSRPQIRHGVWCVMAPRRDSGGRAGEAASAVSRIPVR